MCDVCANNMVSHKIGYEKWCKVKYGDLPIIDFYKNATKIKNGTATLKEIKREIWLSKNSRLPTVNRIFTE